MLIRTLIAWETAAVTLELTAFTPAAAPLTRDSAADSRVNGLVAWAGMVRSRVIARSTEAPAVVFRAADAYSEVGMAIAWGSRAVTVVSLAVAWMTMRQRRSLKQRCPRIRPPPYPPP